MPANGNSNQEIIIQTTGAGPGFPATTSLAGQPGYPISNPPVKGATVPYWSYGSVVPTFTAPYGSLYSNLAATTASATGPLFVFVPSSVAGSPGVWQIVGGSGSSGVTQIVAGTNITISPVGGTGIVTVNATVPTPEPVFDTLARAYAHYYTMDDVSGTTIADTGATAGSPGTYSLTGLTLNQIALRNDNEGCPIFDGASGYATIPDTTSPTGFTVAGMIALNPKVAGSGGSYYFWMTNNNVAGVDAGFILYTNDANLTILWGGGSSSTDIVATNFLGVTAYSPVPPFFAVFTHNGTVGSLYLNGFLIGQATNSYSLGGNPIYIGSLVGPVGPYVPGAFGKMIVHNAALTQSQVSALTNAQRIG